MTPIGRSNPPQDLQSLLVQARVNGFGINANVSGIGVWMECETTVRRKP